MSSSHILYYHQGDLTIELYKCIHIYEGLSATGKTFLPRFAEKFADAPRFIRVATKKEYDALIAKGRDILFSEDDILFLDRFDLFGTEKVIEVIRNFQDVCVLIDYKQFIGLPFKDIRLATIKFDGRRFEVKSEGIV